MKSLFAFFVATAIPLGIASAACVPTSVIDLAGTSEEIAVGTIVRVEKETVTLKGEDLLVGSGTPISASQDSLLSIKTIHMGKCIWWPVPAINFGQRYSTFGKAIVCCAAVACLRRGMRRSMFGGRA